MRKISVVLAIAACAASSLSLAQRREPPADIASPAATESASAEAAENGATEGGATQGKSGFGQVMSVLTTLLQEAAARQTTGGPENASQLLSSDDSAVTIKVTPVAGRSTFFVDKPGRARSEPAKSTPPARVAGANVEAAQGTQMAMQAEGTSPD